jgi:hypothetical protein
MGLKEIAPALAEAYFYSLTRLADWVKLFCKWMLLILWVLWGGGA